MFDDDYLASFTRFCGFKLLVRANRLRCDNDLARLAHDRLLAKLCSSIELMQDGIVAKRDMIRDDGSERCQDASEKIYWIEAEFEHWFSVQPHALLDRLIIDPATNEIYDDQLRLWHILDEERPRLHDVSDAELCGLRRIIEQIAAEIGLSFSACRIVYARTEGSR